MSARSRLSSKKGSSLMIALLIAVAMAVIGATLFATLRAQMKETVFQERAAEAQAIAEAGIEDALLQIALKPSWKTGYNQRLFAGGYYTVTVSTDKNPWVVSHGYSAPIALLGRAHRRVTAQAVVSYGVYNFGNTSFTMNGVTDAYDSFSYPAPTAAQFISSSPVTGNNTVSTPGAGQVKGDVIYITPPAPTNVTGTITQEISTVTIDVMDATPYNSTDTNMNNYLINNYPGIMVSTSDVIVYSTYTAGKAVNFRTGNYYFTSLYVYGTVNVKCQTPTAASPGTAYNPIVIYMDGPLLIGTSGQMLLSGNKCKRPQGLWIYGQGGNTFVFQSTKTVATPSLQAAAVVSPQDNLVVSETLYGKLVGDNVTVAAGKSLHFDLSLYSTDTVTGVEWSSGSWSMTWNK